MEVKPVVLNETRTRWLEYLRVDGWHAWSHMPRSVSGLRAIDNRTWRPMIDAGWIEAEFRETAESMDWFFRATPAGLAQLTKDSP